MCLFDKVLLTVDFDRTLTAPDSTTPQRNLEAIEYFISHGGAFTVNTGRSLPQSTDVLQKVPMHRITKELKRRGYEIVSETNDMIDEPKFEDAAFLGKTLLEAYEKGEIGKIYIAYTRFKN